MLEALIATVIALAAQAGQSAYQWLQSPQGQHFLKHCCYHLAKEVEKYFSQHK